MREVVKMTSFIVLDIETTGINPMEAKITEIGAIKVKNDHIVEEFNVLIDPQTPIPENIVALTGITNEMVEGCPSIEEVLPEFLSFVGDERLPIMGHNIMFDYSFLKYNATLLGYKFEKEGIDTLKIAKMTLSDLESRSLENLCYYFQLVHTRAHRALDDTKATYELYKKLYGMYGMTHEGIFEPKPLQWRPKKKSPMTEKQRKYLEALLKKHKLSLEVQIDQLSKSEASKKIDEINFKYGRRA